MSKCEKKCEYCVHLRMCEIWKKPNFKTIKETIGCDYFKDKSLFVELPCKVGETNFYKITESVKSFAEWFVELSKTKSIDGDITSYYNLGTPRYGKWTEDKQEALDGTMEWLQRECKK